MHFHRTEDMQVLEHERKSFDRGDYQLVVQFVEYDVRPGALFANESLQFLLLNVVR